MWAPVSLAVFLASWPFARASRIISNDVSRASRIISSGAGTSSYDVDLFAGLVLESDFDSSEFWDRVADKCPRHMVNHSYDVHEIFSASYNECSGVSDFVDYGADGSRFVSGNGRGHGWQNDEKLMQIMKDEGKKRKDYATATDYNGCGYFGMDRGHQAPIGTYNVDKVMATMTNMVTNLSPQNFLLNQRNWMYLEKDMRKKALSTEEAEESTVEMLTGPLYELPDAFFQNERGNELWKQVLVTGGEANKGTPWCGEKEGGNFHSATVISKKGKTKEMKVKCQVRGGYQPETAAEDPNKLKIYYQRSEKYFPLRVPLGYYKLMVMKEGARHGRQTCAYVMDQVGQCLLVSFELLSKMAHLDFSSTEFAKQGGTVEQPADSDADYTASVNASFCIPHGGTLQKKNGCYLPSAKFKDPDDITVKMMQQYWALQDYAS